MSLLDLDDVPEPKSLASTRPTDSPLVAASSATPAPTTPPPTTSTWCSVCASPASAASRSSGPSLTVTPASELTLRTLPAQPGPDDNRPASRPARTGRLAPAGQYRRAIQRRPSPARRGAGRHHDLDPLELLQVRVPGGGHRPAECAHQVHGAVGHGRRAVQDLLEGPDGADLDPGPARQVGMMRLAAPVIAAAWRLRGAGERRGDHHRIRAQGQRFGDVAAASHATIRDHVHVPAAGLVEILPAAGTCT